MILQYTFDHFYGNALDISYQNIFQRNISKVAISFVEAKSSIPAVPISAVVLQLAAITICQEGQHTQSKDNSPAASLA